MVFDLNLDTETVGHLDLPQPLRVAPSATIREVMSQLQETRRGSASVCSDDKLVGIFTERDALTLMADGASLDAAVETVMSANPVSVQATDTVRSAIEKMSVGGYRRLPVLDDAGAPIGLLKVSTILRYLVQHFPAFVYNLPPQPNPSVQREGA